MDDIHGLLSECSNLRSSEILTSEELDIVNKINLEIDGIEWPIGLGESDELDPNMEIKEPQAKSFFFTSVFKIVQDILKDPNKVSKIQDKVTTLKSKGVTSYVDIKNNLLKDVPFLHATLRGSKYGVQISKHFSGGLVLGSILSFIVLSAIMIVIAIILPSGGTVVARVGFMILKVIMPMAKEMLKTLAKNVAMATAFGAAAGGIGVAASSKANFKATIADIVSLAKKAGKKFTGKNDIDLDSSKAI